MRNMLEKVKQNIKIITWILNHPIKVKNYLGSLYLNEYYLEPVGKEKKLKIKYILADELFKQMKIKPVVPKLYDLKNTLEWGITTYEMYILINLLKRRVGNFLEVGTFEGRTTLNIAKNNKKLDVYTIDLPQNEVYKRGYNYLVGNKFKNKGLHINQIFEDTQKFNFFNLDKKFGFIFIDASHFYKDVFNDTNNALKILNKGGIILWHDYSYKMTKQGIIDSLLNNKIKGDIYKIEGTSFLIYHKK